MGRNLARVSLITLCVTSALSCGKKGLEIYRAPLNGPGTELQGDWLSACQNTPDGNSVIEGYSIVDDRIAARTHLFIGAGCATLNCSTVAAGTFEPSSEGLVVQYVNIVERCESAETVASYNQNARCNRTNWKVGVPANITDCAASGLPIPNERYQIRFDRSEDGKALKVGESVFIKTETEN